VKHIYCQVIDDVAGKTVASASTIDKSYNGKSGGNCDAAAEIGRLVAERMKAAGVNAACLDRGSCKYHGRVAALADAMREAGVSL
jgi:large subunit ribosomal protein L18